MGACYSVYLKVRFDDEEGAKKTLQDYIADHNGKETNFALDLWEKEGVGTDTIDDLMKIFLAGWSVNDFHKDILDDNGTVLYTNDFNASYGWECVMRDMFWCIIPFISRDSTFEICPENEYYTLGINEKGEMYEFDEGNIDDEDDYDEDDDNDQLHAFSSGYYDD